MKKKLVKLIVTISISLIIIDQISKFLVIKFIQEPIGNENFSIYRMTNTGMAMGFNEGNNQNILVTILVLLVILNFIIKQIERIDKKTAVALSMVIGGGISNLIDRVFRNGVIDFIKIYKFFIFNLADVFIVAGWILLIIFLIMYSRKK